MEKKNGVFKFGETVEGFDLPVLNEREIRAAAGLLFLVMFISILNVIYKGNFSLLKYSIVFFLTDMIVRVLINPRFSPALILGRLMVRRQAPEYVGAAQKRFAWTIGIAIATVMFILVDLMNTYSPVTGILCFTCLIFLFFETAFGICLGCSFYSWFHKDKARYCPGEVCETKKKEDIQKTSVAQIIMLAAFIGYVFIIVSAFREDFSKRPRELYEKVMTATTK